ncbi:MAG: branched-chain amino acid transaminase [archaeon]
MNEVDKIWINGKLLPWKDAKVHVLTHALHYGSAVFEGIRCYKTVKGPAIFRFSEHMKRLYDSAKIIGMEIPYRIDELCQATRELIRANRLQECYIRPIAFYGYGKMGLSTLGCKVDVSIAVWPWGAYLGEDGLKNGIRVRIASFSRHHPNVMMTKAKVTGNYINSILAKREAQDSGYEEAVFLDTNGFVSEGSGENIFIVRNGSLTTPPAATILEGITRNSVIYMAGRMGIQVSEEAITRDQLYTADEVFFTGTAAELTPIREIDNRVIGKPGPVTKKLQKQFFSIITGESDEYSSWLDPV